MLTKIISTVKEKSNLNQWKNTQSVIKWFSEIHITKKMTFIQFDICEFYPSITEKLLIDAITFAEKYVKISDDKKEIIFHARKSFMVSGGKPWMKKQNENVDVGMGSRQTENIKKEMCKTVNLQGLKIMMKQTSKVLIS